MSHPDSSNNGGCPGNGNGSVSTKNAALTSVPRHVAIIMDGNGRWAAQHGLPRVEGHRRGGKTLRAIVEEARRIGIRYLTLFCFSTENWKRPELEVSALMRLFKQYLESELELMVKNDIRLRSIGDTARLPDFVREALRSVEDKTKSAQGMDLVLAVSYGGRDEIARAVRRIVAQVQSGALPINEPGDLEKVIDESLVSQFLYAPELPDPELLIRTSDEFRISNFMLWQLAYSEIVVTSVLWPDFTVEEFHRCLTEFSRRERRFGLTDEQIKQQAAAQR